MCQARAFVAEERSGIFSAQVLLFGARMACGGEFRPYIFVMDHFLREKRSSLARDRGNEAKRVGCQELAVFWPSRTVSIEISR